MLTDKERARVRELYELVELSNASPEEFEELQVLKKKDDNPIFVFGSNELGRHGGGAAKVARDKYGAIYGQGFGPQGNSFGIPTCSKPTGEPNCEISEASLKYYVSCFLIYAGMHPELEFKVTQVGCGLAGWTIDEVAPLFINAPDNCSFDTAWARVLSTKTSRDGDRKYWGHVA